MTAGLRFRETLKNNKPLQIVGCINAYCALMAEKVGHKSVYLSGAGVSNASFGMPDLGMTSLNDVVEDAKRITSVTNLPLLVDIDTGWGGAFNISRTIKEMYRSGVASIHIEDQVGQKRCGHRPNKEMVSTGLYSNNNSNDISDDGIDNDEDGLIDGEDDDEFGAPRDSALKIASKKMSEDIISNITSTW